MNKYDMYLIKWRDHFSTEGWTDIKDPAIFSDLVFQTVGFFVKEDKHYYHFAMTVGEDTCGDIMSILKKSILEMNTK